MMTVDVALLDYLRGRTEIVNEVGTRMHQDELPIGEGYPAILFQLIATDTFHHTSGGAGWAAPLLQVTVQSKKRSDCTRIGELVREALDGFQGTFGDLRIHSCMWENTSDFNSPDPSDKARTIRNRAMDFRVAHKQTIPVFA